MGEFMLQPSDLFKGLSTEIVASLIRTTNDKFWCFHIDKYDEIVKKQIENNKDIPNVAKPYLKGLIDYVNDKKINESSLKNLYNNSGKIIQDKKIISEFGEILGPFFAAKYVVKYNVHKVVFPVRQNYEVFDFFIKNEHHYGFSSKAMTGGSNTLAPKLIMERLDKTEMISEFRKYDVEIKVIRNLTKYSMFEGVVRAFGDLVNDGHFPEFKEIFKKTKFDADSIIIEKNKNKKITEINLSDSIAYANFLNEFIIESTKISELEKEKFRTGKTSYTTTNIVYGMIKVISSKKFDFDFIMKQCFQDLNIVKMDLKNGVPIFKMQSVIEAENTVTPNNYVFRSKAAFDRVRDKLGIQL